MAKMINAVLFCATIMSSVVTTILPQTTNAQIPEKSTHNSIRPLKDTSVLAKSNTLNKNANDKATLSDGPTGSNYRIVASVGFGDTLQIDGFKIKNLAPFVPSNIRPIISEAGQVLFTAETDKGPVAFIDNKAIAYIGMQIGGETVYNFGPPNMSKNGTYGFIASLTNKFNTKKCGLIINGHIVSECEQKYFYPATPKGCFCGDHLRVPAGFSTPVLFNDANEFVVPVPTDDKSSRLHAIVNGVVADIKELDSALNKKIYYRSVNNRNQSIGWGPLYLEATENTYFPTYNGGRAVKLNNNGHIFTSDLQLYNYEDAKKLTSYIPENFDEEHDKYIIDFPYEKLLGLKAIKSKNNKKFYDIILEVLNSYDISFTDNDQFALLQHYAVERDGGGNVIKDGWAIIAGTALPPSKVFGDDCFQQQDIIPNWHSIPQVQPNWCWAAVGEMMMMNNPNGKIVPQCLQAAQLRNKNESDCCDTSKKGIDEDDLLSIIKPSSCDAGSDLGSTLTRNEFTFKTTSAHNPFSFLGSDGLKMQISCNHKPVAYYYNADVAYHYRIIYGYYTKPIVSPYGMDYYTIFKVYDPVKGPLEFQWLDIWNQAIQFFYDATKIN